MDKALDEIVEHVLIEEYYNELYLVQLEQKVLFKNKSINQ
jgi:hypothetical protein